MAYDRAFLLALFTVIITVLLSIPQSEAADVPAPAPASHGVGIHESCMNGCAFLLVSMLFAFLFRP